jgi:type I restriction enzyme M protein
MTRDKVDLDIAWLCDDSLEDMENLPAPEIIAREIVKDLTAALAEFEAVATALECRTTATTTDYRCEAVYPADVWSIEQAYPIES